MAKNILITGAKGQLGSELSELFSQYPEFNFIPTDIAELDLTIKEAVASFVSEQKIDYIVNCAAYTAVDKAEDDIDLCYKINRDAVRNLAEAAAGKAKIIHVSTDYVFDGTAVSPYQETDATNPQSVYGKSKLAGEEALWTACPESLIIRTAWLYSIYGNNFVKTMIRLGKERPDLNVVADQKGTPTYAADLAQAILSVIVYAEKTNAFPAGIYHYSNEGITTWFEFTELIHQLAGITTCNVHPIPTSQYPTKATRPMYSVLDKTKIKQTVGIIVPQWEESLKRCIERM
ncbi:MAG: dTDP-4-dehydrorhamnose reductase [Candidatus Ordinivivax streblomastigis]|uniref:dTDP-4-dehydrorhamnose reductase n=1 Tax=Candidatus Ordinivivax streblomastigis TaxID=2540710 RepID=A0A5M8NZ51_9BACT|nr:MAG: dTDP-4-dehydrorhamnose reductase [Candidatus Ordinivivax streblomastigis]